MTTSEQPGMALRIAAIVALLAMVAPFTIDTYLPSFPDIAADLSASPLQMQQTLSLYLLGFAITTLFYGPLSDALGRRRVVMGALAIYALSSVACAVSNDIHTLIAMRIGQGMSASAGLVVGRAMVRDVFSGHHAQQVMARVMMIFAVAPALAPMVGAWLHDLYGWRAIFWFLALLGVALMAMVGFATPETLPREGRHSLHPLAIGRAYGEALRHRRFMALTTAFALMFGGFFLYVAGAPVVIYDHLHLGLDDFWVLFVPMVFGIIGGSLLATRLAGRVTPSHSITIGFLIMGGASLLNLLQAVVLPPAPSNVIGPMVLYALGVTVAMPSLSLLALDCFPRNRGMASAVQGFSQMAFNALVAGAVVPLVIHELPLLASSQLLLCVVAYLVWHLHGREAANVHTAP